MQFRRPTHLTLLTFGSALFLTLLDQVTKMLASAYLDPLNPIRLISGKLHLTLTHNPGAAFGFMRNLPDKWRLITFTIMYVIAAVMIVSMYRHRPQHSRLIPVSISLISGGAVGNLIDRYRFGYVVDFIDTFPFGYHFPTFNIADSCITTGVTLMIIHMLFFERNTDDAS